MRQPQRIATAILVSLAVFTGNAISADQRVITDDGREVLLKNDGTWRFLSNDRFADTGDGLRVRLKDDGSWSYIGNAPMVSNERVRTDMLDISLDKAVIETHEVRVQKNTRVKSQTVFYLTLALSGQAVDTLRFNAVDISRVDVTDNKGRQYPVLSMRPSAAEIKPGKELKLAVRADGSPQWWKNVKSMDIVFQPGLFGLTAPVRLGYSVDDMVKTKVGSFELE